MSQAARIVIADDNGADVGLLREILDEQNLRHELHVITDGEAALRFAEFAGNEGKHPCPDLFVLDLHLPRIDGADVLRRFRANENCTHTPVIIFSGSAFPKDRAAVESFPGVSFVKKPAALNEFMQVGQFIRDVLTLKAE